MAAPVFKLGEHVSADPMARVTYFARTDTRNRQIPFGIKALDRSRHMYVIGKTGMGKSTLLENMAIQDIQNGEGITFIDPHGGTAEKLLDYVPENRVNDVLYFAPFDLQYPISFNVLENVEPDRRHLVVNGLMSTFEKLWADQWSARMAYILQNTLAALLEFPDATLLGVNRVYIDKEYRKKVIANLTDPSVRSFWVDEYAKYTDRYAQEATPAIQNKIGQFASNALVRNIIGQSQSAFNIRELMDSKKIFIVNLSKGRVGEGNANLLGSMLITKIYLAAMSRADAPAHELAKLPESYLYVDEFQNFANRSFADILSEARKYKLALTIAHQYIEQMEEEVRAAVFGNVGTMVTFRVGSYDAEILEKEFAPVFTMEDIVNLGARQIYLKLMIDGVSSQPFSSVTLPPIDAPPVSHRDRAIAFSRRTFSRPRSEVEDDIKKWTEQSFADPNDKMQEDTGRPRRSMERADRSAMRSNDSFNNSTGRYESGSYERPYEHRATPRPVFNNRDNRDRGHQDYTPRTLQSEREPVRREHTSESLKSVLQKIATQSKEKEHQNAKPAPSIPQEKIRKDTKSATEADRKELKGLLTSVLKEHQVPPKQEPVTPSSVPKRMQQEAAPLPKEVPEDVLRQLLEVETEAK